MATSIIAGLFAPHDQWLYVLKVAAVGGAVWFFRRVYASLALAPSYLALAVGTAIGIAWVLTDPAGESGNALAIWLATLPTWVAVLWLGCRGFGTVVLVPIAEELAFPRLFAARSDLTRFRTDRSCSLHLALVRRHLVALRHDASTLDRGGHCGRPLCAPCISLQPTVGRDRRPRGFKPHHLRLGRCRGPVDAAVM